MYARRRNKAGFTSLGGLSACLLAGAMVLATVQAASAVVCVLPDNGSGTVDMPPQCPAGYQSAEDVHIIIDGLPPGTQIIIDATHIEFGLTSSGPGGTLGGEFEQFSSLLMMEMSGTGALATFSRTIFLSLACETHIGPRTLGDPVQTFPNDMFQLQGALSPGDPDFDLLTLTAGTDFGLPSPGETTLTQLAGGNWSVDSFFDITYQIDYIGAPGGALSGMGGTTTATIRMRAGGPPPPDRFADCPGLTTDTSHVTFGGTSGVPPIPADFFGPGSDPFQGQVPLEGFPIDPLANDATSTRLQRLVDPFDVLDPPGPGMSIEIEIVELSLVSIAPVDVTVGGTVDSQWDLEVDLSPGPQQPGQLLPTKTHPNGGTYSADFFVQPRFTFTRVGDPADVRVLDPRIEGDLPLLLVVGQPPFPQAPWVHTVDPALNLDVDPAAQFVPGVDGSAIVQTVQSTSAVSPDGGLTITHVVCPPPLILPCVPSSIDPTACEPTVCPVPTQECKPRCIQYDPITGTNIVIDCDCRDIDDCHAVPGAGPCVVVDNGTGTVTLPPFGCDYVSPADLHEMINGLPPGTTIQIATEHKNFINISEVPGGSLGGNIETFDSQLRLVMTGTGSLAGFNRDILVSVQCEVHTAPRTPGDAVQDFDNDMFSLQGEIFGDPDFDLIRITGGTNNGMPGPGHTTLTRQGLPGSDFAVDSFFDVAYQIEFVGAPGSILQGLGGTTSATLRMAAGPTPSCAGTCPPGQVCTETRTLNADGTIDLCCDCGSPATGACCLSNGTCVVTTATGCAAQGGLYQGDGTICAGIVACCLGDGSCVDADALCCLNVLGGTPQPGGLLCVDTTCPQSVCEPAPDGQSCTNVACPVPPLGDECQPKCVDIDPASGAVTITDCECRGANECHFDMLSQTCIGGCPPGMMCETMVSILPDGTQHICCDCVPDPTGACCLGDGTCIVTTASDCATQGGAYQGDGSVCGGSVEGCCLPDGTCTDADILCCTNVLGGTPQGAGTACSATPVSCCLPDGSCQDVDPLCCDDLGGVPNALGIPCGGTQACCDATTGACYMADRACCLANGDTPEGPGTTCTAPQACCLADGTCQHLDPLCCEDLGGLSGGLGSACGGIVACCLPDGTCTDADAFCCTQLGGTPDSTGLDCANTTCSQPVCEPTVDGLACTSVACAAVPDECLPTCVTYDPLTGATLITQCDCRGVNDCQSDVAIGPIAGVGGNNPCVVIDNGTGTVTLPPAGCEYLTDAEVHEIIDGLPAGTTIEFAPIHKSFICKRGGGAGCPPPGLCEEPGGSLGGHVDCFDSVLSMQLNGTGALVGFNRAIDLSVVCRVETGPRNPGAAVQDFDTEMVQLQGQLFGDPDFDLLQVTAGSGNGLPSPGHTTLTQLPGGDFAVDSFFDITYQIDFVGSPGGALAGMSGSTIATIRMGTGTPPGCVGNCPPNTACVERTVVNPDGTLEVCCTCEAIATCTVDSDCAGVDLTTCTIEKCDAASGVCVTMPFVSGDIDKDGGSGLADLLILLNILGGSPEDPNADIDGDGVIGLGDLLVLLNLLGGAAPDCP